MSSAVGDEAILSREELSALLEEMPKIWTEDGSDAPSSRSRSRAIDADLVRANESFATEHGLKLSNRYQRVISLSMIGHREIEMNELAELMLPTDLAASFQILPRGFDGFVLLSRPFFFHLLSMSFGSGPTIKPVRPPTRKYTRIERRFYERATREILAMVETAWSEILPVHLEWIGLSSRSSVAQAEAQPTTLATFEVKGFGETCRLRVAVPRECFVTKEIESTAGRTRLKSGPEVSVLDVPLDLRAQVGFADLTLAQVGALQPGQVIDLETPTDGSLTVTFGGRKKFKAIAGARGARRAIQLSERLDQSGEAEDE